MLHHPVPSGSVTVSSSSCAIIEVMASAPTFEFGDVWVWTVHAEFPPASPINEYFISVAGATAGVGTVLR